MGMAIKGSESCVINRLRRVRKEILKTVEKFSAYRRFLAAVRETGRTGKLSSPYQLYSASSTKGGSRRR